ncbi:hypothetical protein CHS0354_037221 [Potamilus streckersoni]|uniref:Uncharacterized protein n=1 Tax=Potamilus streckersoni TaxID=2493646 RepID=A0AAE0W3H7_9BIVA|nr:hypothetical protein CHS0354_037221 [Potamilus streckersoni]
MRRGLFYIRSRGCKHVILSIFIFIFLFLCMFIISVTKYSTQSQAKQNDMLKSVIRVENNCKEFRLAQFETVPYSNARIRIIVIVYNRATSLRRLLDSLNKAHYFGDTIALHVWIDRSKNGTIDSTTYGVASDFTFRHGQYYVHNQTCHAGIYGQWMGTWYPKSNSSEFAVILEDDLTVSPYFYKWLKLVHMKYDNYSNVNGYSLQGISIKHGATQSGYLEVNETHTIFLYPVLGTWGFSPNNRNWRAFSDWYQEVRRDPKFRPLVPGIHPSVWYKEQLAKGHQDRMWSMWFIYYAWMNRELTVYSNFKGHKGLAINWKEHGLHYSEKDSKRNPDPLLVEWKQEYEDFPEQPVIIDVNGKEVKQRT